MKREKVDLKDVDLHAQHVQLICERIVMLIYRGDLTTTSLYHDNVNFRFQHVRNVLQTPCCKRKASFLSCMTNDTGHLLRFFFCI